MICNAGLSDFKLECRERGVIAIKHHRHHAADIGRPHQQPGRTRSIDRRQQISVAHSQCLPACRRRDEEACLTGADRSGQSFKRGERRRSNGLIHGRMPP